MADLPLFDPFKVLAEVRRSATEPPQQLPQQPAEAKEHTNQLVIGASAASATSAGSKRASPLAPACANEIVWKNSSSSSNTYARAGARKDGQSQATDRTPAEVAGAAGVSIRDCSIKENTETAPAEVLGGTLRKWRSALAALSPERAPCPGYRGSEWAHVHTRALAFLDEFGPQAIALGWTASRLFGVHREAGIVRVDACGALMLPGTSDVRVLAADAIGFGHLVYRTKPGQPEGVPVWRFGR